MLVHKVNDLTLNRESTSAESIFICAIKIVECNIGIQKQNLVQFFSVV